jgi:hypothetical protein
VGVGFAPYTTIDGGHKLVRYIETVVRDVPVDKGVLFV